MGGWDVYCALCGGPIRRVWWDADDSPHAAYDREVFANSDDPGLEWLEDIRLIGENPATASDSKVWLSGPARAEEYGAVSYQNGENPDPAILDLEGCDGDSGCIRVYNTDGVDDPFCAPFHTHCKKLLCKYLGVSELNKEVFLESLKSLAEEGDGGRALDIEYGDIREHMEQYWWPQPGTEHFVCDPVEVKGLAEFYNQLPTRDTSDFGSPRTYNTEGDPFTRLPADVLLMLISLFPSMSDVFSLRIASPVVANLHLGNGFWRRQLKTRMPWLWDLPEPTDSQVTDVDWRNVYHKLDWGSRPESQRKNKFHGLCNRRRIWETICPVVAEAYADFSAKNDAWGSPEAPVLRSVVISPLIPIGSRSWAGMDREIMTLLDNYLEITTARPFLLVSWSEDRHSFHDIRVFRDESELMARKQMIRSHVVDTVPVPDDDWITGFIFRGNMASDNDGARKPNVVGLEILFVKQEPVKLGAGTADTCRFFHASENHFIVGFRCYRDDEDHSLTHMKLLEQPLTNVGDCPRVSDRSVGGYNTTQGFWAGDLPPRNVCTSKNHLRLTWSYMGYNYPTEWLMLGESAEEQADITGISVDSQLGGFEVYFQNQPTRRIGPAFHAMKSLSIDGQDGERIAQICVPRSTQLAMMFVTNRGRCLSLGISVSGYEPLTFGDEHDPDVSKVALCGIYGGWSEYMGAKHLLNGFGAFGSSELPICQGEITPLAQDGDGYFWEPERPLAQLVEIGPIYGSRTYNEAVSWSAGERVEKKVPSMGCVVSALDVDRPIVEVRVTLVHSNPKCSVAPIAAIQFTYLDGEKMVVGPDRFSNDPICRYCDEKTSLLEETRKVPHYRHEVWSPGDKKLTKLRIWPSETGGLGAIRFVAEGGAESPLWGYWGFEMEGKECEELKFVGEQCGTVIGLKVFFQGLERGDRGDDTVIVAFQGLAHISA
ncbi:unnamed protein product [Clonostachys rosea f. rosea IK726]|uniref:Uncharacterized protein n=1 Tax=Clonostachys rosea f. rosea IK726 TaxID=1349383 RepID=A0ACA9U1Q8_BIOOC|nr:unnamed protein product [Clonostachys rosea f. rosea IK726]